MRTYLKAELDEIIEKHSKWIKDSETGERADLRDADLRDASLQSSDLRHTYLQHADLRDVSLQYADLRDVSLQCANLQGANLDFSSLPLHCGSFQMEVDIGFVKQILYHVSNLCFEDDEGIKDAIRVFANSATLRKRHNLPEV